MIKTTPAGVNSSTFIFFAILKISLPTKQIITNILTNAAKYTEKGEINFKVSCVNVKDECKLVITIKDTGRGIKTEQIDKLFNKFQRLDEDKNTTVEGTGLGLAITKRLVEMMGGKIVVQSHYGEGSTFTIYLTQEIRNGLYEKEEVVTIPTLQLTFNDEIIKVLEPGHFRSIKIRMNDIKIIKFYDVKAERKRVRLFHDVGLLYNFEPSYVYNNGKKYYIEAFDNSNIQGTSSVSAMVSFVDGVKNTKGYRKYRVKTIVGSDDVNTFKEIITRRYKRLKDENNKSKVYN